MRLIGTLPSEAEASTFRDYTLTLGIKSSVESDAGEFAVWIFDEDDVPKAKTELEEFRVDPNAAKYQEAKDEAKAVREKEIQEYRAVKKRVVRANEQWNQSYLQRCPVTITLIVLSVAAVMITTNPDQPFDFGKRIEPGLTSLAFSPLQDGPGNSVKWYGGTFHAITHGEIWRIFTPMFLHFGPLHLLFNMMWLRDLGGVIEVRRGKWKFLFLVLLIAGISNVIQGLVSGPYFGGMSGVVFGLFGYVWMQSRFVPTSGFFMPPNLVLLMMIWMGICFTGAVGAIANGAHLGGLIVGMFAGYAPKFLQDMGR